MKSTYKGIKDSQYPQSGLEKELEGKEILVGSVHKLTVNSKAHSGSTSMTSNEALPIGIVSGYDRDTVLKAKNKAKEKILEMIRNYIFSSPQDEKYEFGKGYRSGLERAKKIIEDKL